MKTIYKSIFFIALTGLLLSSCAKNDDFSVPTIPSSDCVEPEWRGNVSIESVFAKAQKDVLPYNKEAKDILEGVVISSDKGGNFHNKLHIVDRKTQKVAIISIEESSSFTLYPPGTTVYIKLAGLYFNNSYGLLNIGGGIHTSASGNKYTGTIPKGSINKFVSKSCKAEDINALNNIVTLAELIEKKDSLKGKLVTVTGVQFNRNLIGKKLYDKSDTDTQGQTLREMVDEKNNSFFIRTSQYANGFIGYEIPKYSGRITGIMDVFGTSIQFYPRIIEDINLTEQPFGDTPVDPGEEVTLGKFLAFPGADFENWDAFLGSIRENKLSDATAQKADGTGWENSRGLAVKGTRTNNGFLFSVEKVKTPKDATKLSFLVKGTSTKSLSINVYKANGTNYYGYNIENLTTSKVIQPNLTETVFDGVPSGNTTNIYAGNIDTKGKWVKVTLDLGAIKASGGDYHTAGTGTFIAFRNGSNTNYDLVIDEIRFEDGTPVEDGGTDPVDPEPGAQDFVTNFNDWNAFTANLTTIGLKPYATHAPGQGRNGKDALKISGTPTANDFVFVVTNKQVPAGKTKLIVWVKGTAAAKSLSFNVHKASGFDPFNAGIVASSNLTLTKFTSNQYTGTINTGNQWVKLTLDLSATEYNTTGSGDVFALKTGKDSAYELLIDSIYFE